MLQHLRRLEQKEQEAEKLRDEQFNQYWPMVPQGKVWKAKAADQPVRLVEPSQSTGLTGTTDRFDRQEQPVIPVEPAVEQKAESAMPVLVPCEEEAPLAAPV